MTATGKVNESGTDYARMDDPLDEWHQATPQGEPYS